MATNLDTATAHIDARSHHTNELPILERANDVDDVVRNLNQIIDCAMSEQSTIGYFAVLYKRSTMAIREAIDGDLFKNSARMAAFDVVYLHPPGRWTPFPALVHFLGRGESRDVAGNLHALNRIAEHPADVRPAFR